MNPSRVSQPKSSLSCLKRPPPSPSPAMDAKLLSPSSTSSSSAKSLRVSANFRTGARRHSHMRQVRDKVLTFMPPFCITFSGCGWRRAEEIRGARCVWWRCGYTSATN